MPIAIQVVLDVFFVLSVGGIAVMFAWSVIIGSRRSDRAQQAVIDMATRSQHNNEISASASLALARTLAELHQEQQLQLTAPSAALPAESTEAAEGALEESEGKDEIGG